MNQNENFIKQLYKGHDLFIILKVYLDLQQILIAESVVAPMTLLKQTLL